MIEQLKMTLGSIVMFEKKLKELMVQIKETEAKQYLCMNCIYRFYVVCLSNQGYSLAFVSFYG